LFKRLDPRSAPSPSQHRAAALAGLPWHRVLAPWLLLLATLLYLALMARGTRIATIRMGDEVAVLRTVNTDPEVIVAGSKFALRPDDVVQGGGGGAGFISLSIARKFPVSIQVDGQTHIHSTYGGTVHQVLLEAGFPIGEYDVPSLPYNTETEPAMRIRLDRVWYETVQNEVEIPFDVRRVPSLSVPEGRVAETQSGVPGLAVATLERKVVEGTPVETRTLSSEVVRNPVTAVVTYGTGGTVATSRSATTRFSYVLDVTATAYTYGESGKWGDVTATGKAVQVGYVAVDPRVIPLGSRLYITYPGGEVCYGFAVAEDTGGAIKGNRVDLFFESHEEAVQFGRRRVKVYVLAE